MDTSIFRSHSFKRSPLMKAFQRLAINDFIQLHVPYIVEQEYLSYLYERHVSELDNILHTTKKLNNRIRVTDIEDNFKSVIDIVKEIKAKTLRHINDEIQSWFKNIGAIKHTIKPAHPVQVFDAYFTGSAPFMEKKSRKDIPDAFIYETIKDLKKEYGQIQAIVADKHLRKFLENESNIITFCSLEEFIDSETCQKLLESQSNIEHLELIVNDLKANTLDLEKIIETDYLEQLIGETIRDDYIPDDNNEATIEGVYEPESIEFDFENLKYYGDQIISIPFTFQLEAEAYYYLFKSDLYSLDDSRIKRVSITDHNKHYYEIEETFSLSITGTLAVYIKLETFEQDKKLKNLIDYSQTEIEAVTSILMEGFNHD